MLSKVETIAINGITTRRVEVEVSISERGMPCFEIVGLPDKTVAESRLRIKTAFMNSGISFPNKRVIVNLAPADIHKAGSIYDLPIAVGIAICLLDIRITLGTLFFGELSLDGSVRHTRGAFLLGLYAKENNYDTIFIPKDCSNEVCSIKGIKVYGINCFKHLLDHIRGVKSLKPLIYTAQRAPKSKAVSKIPDIKDIYGQPQAKRAIEISASGAHNILFSGSPGVGKSMLAHAMTGILPPLSEKEAIEVTKIYSSSGLIPPGGGMVHERPFRSPHHTVSMSGLLGGGSNPTPGEISFAHRGVLFLDELSQFKRSHIESLRSPLEDGYITISRSREQPRFPSKFTLVAACNPCPCGFYGHPTHSCSCTPKMISRYKQNLSGPILDRIDLHLVLPSVEVTQLGCFNQSGMSDTSLAMRNRVLATRCVQLSRFKNDAIITNSEMNHALIKKYCFLDGKARAVLDNAVSTFGLSARSYFKLLRIARTLADMAKKEKIDAEHLLEALQFRVGF